MVNDLGQALEARLPSHGDRGQHTAPFGSSVSPSLTTRGNVFCPWLKEPDFSVYGEYPKDQADLLERAAAHAVFAAPQRFLMVGVLTASPSERIASSTGTVRRFNSALVTVIKARSSAGSMLNSS